MNWTEAQLQAIETRDKNILVAAAAGSGKTAVLIERIKQLMLNDKVDIDRFLITTFTNAASAEMRERLEKAINNELDKPDADRAFLKRQLMLLPSANISTFHTFALEVMRKFFYLTDLEPGFRIGDEVEVSIIKREAIDELFENRFDTDYEAFTSFLRKYSSEKSERKLKESLIKLYDQLRSIPDYLNWAEEKAKLLKTKSPINALGLTELIKNECLYAMITAARYYSRAEDMLTDYNLEKLYEKAHQDTEMIWQGHDGVRKKGPEYFKIFHETLKFNQMRATKEEKDDFAEIKDSVSYQRKKGRQQLDDIYKKYFRRSIEEYDNELRDTAEDTIYMIGLIKDMEQLFKEKKQEKNMVDFDDVMHYAIEILRDDMAAGEYRDKFKYIFIDEFQDSNMLQEAIAARICRENNLFMVGDVKQSIYKFRQAEPEIFKAKYELYDSEDEENSIKIDLNSNFRSKEEVTGLVNTTFRQIMSNYDENAELKCTIPDEYPGINPQMHLIFNNYKEDGLMEDSQLEAQYIVQLVKENLGTEIYDTKHGIYRSVEYGDIAVLARNRAIIGDIERALLNSGIPAYGETTGGYFDTVEIRVFINMLKIIDNFRQDIPLISVMRCPVFGFDVKELAAIRIFSGEGAYHEAVRSYSESGDDEALREKTCALLEKINYWKQLKDTVSLEELVRVMLYDTGYYDYCNGLPVGRQRISNLQLLVEKAASFEKTNYSGLYGFLSYVEAMQNSSRSMSEAKLAGESENVVQIMTVHKSKGLEFPIVILAGAGKQIKARGSGTTASFHKDIGIGLPFINVEEKWHRKTILQKIIDGRKAGEEFEEEIRILYVAMTRAMDRLIITGTVKDPEALDDDIGDPKTYIEMIYIPIKEFGGEVKVHLDQAEEIEEVAVGKRFSLRSRIMELLEGSRKLSEEEPTEIIDNVLSFEYPYGQLDKVKSKYSVTELNKLTEQGMNQETSISSTEDLNLSRPAFCAETKSLDAAHIGTVMHLMMERLDFSRVMQEREPYITETANMLLERGELLAEERSVIDVGNIAAFFDNTVGKRAACALRLEKEREFIMQQDIDGAEAIVQGIIDCYFEEDDGLVLVDYKNSFMGGRISEETIIARYQKQIDLYRQALEEAEGKPVKEAYLYLFELHKFVEVR